ncbi:hypothetical protein BDD12DRAFT_841731 [Trichophaea hybrida]|nr:hypothetical protein BDD12DRAFT_841731 [Trichophaea hybrida]
MTRKPSKAPPQSSRPRHRRTPSSLPTNWPSHLPYYTNPSLSPALTRSSPASLNLHLCIPPTPPSPLVRIKPITTPSHPACGQYGLFATRNLPPHSWVLDYLGTYHTLAESDPSSDYDICLDRELGVAVDAARGGNEARFVNDYRGVAERANVVFENREVQGQVRIAVRVAGKEVRKGEELLVSYGKGFWEGRRREGEKE